MIDPTIAQQLKDEFAETVDKVWRLRQKDKTNHESDGHYQKVPMMSAYPEIATEVKNAYSDLIDLYQTYTSGKWGLNGKENLAKQVSARMTKLYHTLENRGKGLDLKYEYSPFQLWRSVYWDSVQDYERHEQAYAIRLKQEEVRVR